MDREAARLRRELELFEGLLHLAEDEDNVKGAEKLRGLAWANVEAADPIRVLYARQLLGLSDRTIADWCKRLPFGLSPSGSAAACEVQIEDGNAVLDLVVSFSLTEDEMKGGKKYGLLENSINICKG